MKVLVIGNTGFIGNFLTKRLIEDSYEVVGIDIKPPISRENPSTFVLGDILNPKAILKAMQGVDAIIHLVAKHHDFGVSREEFFKVNVGGMQNILDCASQTGIKKIIFYSTVSVYGNVESYTTENTVTNPVTDYGESKLTAEMLLCNWVAQDQSRQAAIIRSTVVFGPGNYANMYNLIDKIYKKRFIFVGKGKNIKSVAYVENLVDATIFILEKLYPGVEIYNYSDYPQMNTEQIVKTIAQYLSYNMLEFRIPLKPALILTSGFDILWKFTNYNFPITAARIKKFNTATNHNSDKIRDIGFRPQIELSEGFKRTVEWYLENSNNHKVIREEGGEE